jgi:NAD(P)-dependent dehydrogenase (short-subunit alcohol dehydrogenase family)
MGTSQNKDVAMTSFGNKTTTDEVLDGMDLTGCRVVITGGASGLGRESARAMAAHGAAVTVLARNDARAQGAKEDLEALVPGAPIEVGAVDLGDLASIRSFAGRYLSDHEAIDVLINNAGIMACPFGRTVDGFETQFGTNHLGHFLLTALLAPALLRGNGPRVVTLSSAGHSRADVDLVDPNFEVTEYSQWIAYGRSKTANALFARELARQAGPHGLLSFSVHPGGIITDLGRHLDDALITDMIEFSVARSTAAQSVEGASDAPAPSLGVELKSVEAGAATQVWAATTPGLDDHNGAYLADCGLGVLDADPGVNGFMPYLLDDEHAAALWTLSETMVGTSFTL